MLAYQHTHRRVISIFVMAGCGACHDYVPRVQRIAHELLRLGYCLPEIEIIDLEADKHRTADADRFGVQYTPTTVYQHNGHWKKWETSLNDTQLRHVLERASQGMSCEI